MSYLVRPITRSTTFPTQLVGDGEEIDLGYRALVATADAPLTVLAPADTCDAATFAVHDIDNNASANPITLDGNGHLIDGNATVTLNVDGEEAVYIFDVDGWYRSLPPRKFEADDPSPYYRAAEVLEFIASAGIGLPGGAASSFQYKASATTFGGMARVFNDASNGGGFGYGASWASDGAYHRLPTDAGTFISGRSKGDTENAAALGFDEDALILGESDETKAWESLQAHASRFAFDITGDSGLSDSREGIFAVDAVSRGGWSEWGFGFNARPPQGVNGHKVFTMGSADVEPSDAARPGEIVGWVNSDFHSLRYVNDLNEKVLLNGTGGPETQLDLEGESEYTLSALELECISFRAVAGVPAGDSTVDFGSFPSIGRLFILTNATGDGNLVPVVGGSPCSSGAGSLSSLLFYASPTFGPIPLATMPIA